jgi:hypothetical protein
VIVWVTGAEQRGDARLWLGFSDGVAGEVDLSDRLHGEILEPLRDPDHFSKFVLDEEHDTPTWPDGADFAPEFLRERVIAAESLGSERV